MQTHMTTICWLLVRLYRFFVFCLYLSVGLVAQPKSHVSTQIHFDPVVILDPKLITEQLYDDKYLDEYHEMSPHAIFGVSQNQTLLEAECLVHLSVITTRLALLLQFSAWTENMSESVLDDVVCDYFLETFTDSKLMIQPAADSDSDSESDREFEEESHDSESKEDADDFEHVSSVCFIRDVCFNLEKLSAVVKKEMDICETEIEAYPSPELLQQARENVCETVLDPRLVNNFVMEMTPNGNVAMRYSADKGAFEYFSDRAVPRRFLEAVGRKYVITFQCPHLFVDTAAEIEVATVKHAEQAAKTKVREDLQVAEKSKQIFAKFKTYNKPGKKTAATNPYSKNRTSPSASPYQYGKSKDGNKEKNDQGIVQERSNTYIHMDKLSSFSPVQKVAKKEVSKKAVMSYADYKASLAV
jgi:hypothetical protein